jgi:hypothetical protein
MTFSFCLLNFHRGALGDLLSEVQHHDPIRDVHDGGHVVLHQQQGDPAIADRANHLDGAHGLVVVHAGERLVEQQNGGVGR